MWVQGKALSEFEAEPHSAQADKVQIVVSKAYRSRISDKSDIGELNLHRLSSPKRNVDTQRAERFCGGRTCLNNCRGEQRSPVFRICYNFRIVGAWRNFCSQAHKNATARYFLPFELSGNITIMYLENNLASKIQQSQHYTSERAVEGASPYKRDRIVFCSVLQWL